MMNILHPIIPYTTVEYYSAVYNTSIEAIKYNIQSHDDIDINILSSYRYMYDILHKYNDKYNEKVSDVYILYTNDQLDTIRILNKIGIEDMKIIMRVENIYIHHIDDKIDNYNPNKTISTLKYKNCIFRLTRK